MARRLRAAGAPAGPRGPRAVAAAAFHVAGGGWRRRIRPVRTDNVQRVRGDDLGFFREEGEGDPRISGGDFK